MDLRNVAGCIGYFYSAQYRSICLETTSTLYTAADDVYTAPLHPGAGTIDVSL